MNEPQQANGKIPQRIKAMIVAPTTVVLENGDIIVVQTVVTDVVRVVGQKDAKGLQVYEFQMQHAVGRPEAAMKDDITAKEWPPNTQPG